MRAAFWIVGLFALAVAVTLLARLDQGYVIVVFPPWRLELSFLLTLILLAGGFLLVSFLLHLARTALRLPEDLRAWRERRARQAADQALLDALRAHFSGDAQALRKHMQHARGCAAQDLLTQLRSAEGATDSASPAAEATVSSGQAAGA